MPERWTVHDVLARAPDAKVGAAARRLAAAPVWSATGATATVVFGHCQGTAKDPYAVTVDLEGPRFRCTCPSTKQPCKHAVALLLMWAAGEGTVATVPLSASGEREAAVDAATGGAARSRAAEPVVDPEAQARRRAERLARMTAGLDDLARWMGDLVRQGLAVARSQPYRYWDDAAARLVDAQLPGLADRVRAMGGEVHARDDWAEHLLAELGSWHLAVRAWAGRDDLPPDTDADLRVALGWARRGDEGLGEPVRDRWHVIGRHLDEDERIRSQRTWVVGEHTGEVAVVWDFAAAGAALAVAHVVGSVVDGPVTPHPGSAPRRVRVGEGAVTTPGGARIPGVDVAAALDGAAVVLAANPWARRAPMALAGVVPVLTAGTLTVVGGDGAALDATADDPATVLAVSGGRPVDLFGEWEGGRLRILSIAADDGLVAL